ncbi:UNVERIFIED_CONTAM: hypothetical protein FKN15_055199 [Acipenser sinensis]
MARGNCNAMSEGSGVYSGREGPLCRNDSYATLRLQAVFVKAMPSQGRMKQPESLYEYRLISSAATHFRGAEDQQVPTVKVSFGPVKQAADITKLARLTMQPPKSYSVGGQRSSRAATGKPAGARPDYRDRWCAVSRGHPDRPNPPSPQGDARPIVRRPLEAPVLDRQRNSLDSNSRLAGYRAHPALTWSAFTGCATREPQIQ